MRADEPELNTADGCYHNFFAFNPKSEFKIRRFYRLRRLTEG
jgi:hypothetical protein